MGHVSALSFLLSFFVAYIYTIKYLFFRAREGWRRKCKGGWAAERVFNDYGKRWLLIDLSALSDILKNVQEKCKKEIIIRYSQVVCSL